MIQWDNSPGKTVTNEDGIKWFTLLCVLWWIIGFILITIFSKKELFILFNNRSSALLDFMMPLITTLGEGWLMTIIIILVILLFKRFRTIKFAMASFACLSVPSIFTNIIKRILSEPRPLNYWDNASWIHTLPDYDAFQTLSHPSGHTTGVFSLFCFLSMILSKKNSKWALIFFVIAMITGISRIYLAQHFFDDIWAGSIMGVTVSYIIFQLFYLNEKD